MTLVSKLRALGAVTCMLGMSVTMAEAATIPPGGSLLSDLIAGTTTVTSGDKILSDVFYSAVGADMPTPDQIIVSPIMEMGNFGFRFTGPFLDVADGVASDAFLEFTVSVIAPNSEIVAVTLMGNPFVTGTGVASITETVLPQEPSLIMAVSDQNPGSFLGLVTAPLSKGYTSLRVQKDIMLSAGAGSMAELSFMDQIFTQHLTQQTVPEPASLGLLTFASLGLLAWRRRRP